ncbi:MAG: UvrD-helicase domain-containing protein, partial [Clostridia bacterium]|nr:UvrD-helicase domain-containing protein [Clostridia bacterium]
MNFDLTTLNQEQIKPVLDTEGAVLVTAGAGSGKTRLLTHRIAYLIKEKGVKPYNILAITFTNKAANEMRERLDKMVESASSLWVFTFHALCVRILRKFIAGLGQGYNSNFSIYGESEKEHCIKRILKNMELEEDIVKEVISSISDAKNQGLSPDEYKKANSWRNHIDVIAKAYFEYEKELRKSNSLDYDDLLNKAYYLLRTNDEAREYYQDKFHYIHVDEFQDTNTVQYNIVRVLAVKHGNVFVVGDEDQSIYGWRGANYANIFDFERDFKCKSYKLEQNYRSTKNILALANKIIKNNKERKDKTLWTQNADGSGVIYYDARSDGDEADFVIKAINSLSNTGRYKLSDFAVLMRINALSRSFEERLISYGVPHKIYGGFKFYDRKEVKDLLAYLKILGNPNDVEAITRIINFPKRGIGEGTVKQLINYSAVTGQSLFEVIYSIETNPDLPNGVIKKVLPFSNVLQCMKKAKSTGASLYELTRYIIKLIGLKEYYSEDTEENETR